MADQVLAAVVDGFEPPGVGIGPHAPAVQLLSIAVVLTTALTGDDLNG